MGGYESIAALVNGFLRFGNPLNPINGLCWKVDAQSLVCSIMFQLL